MPVILLDTHIWVWLVDQSPDLKPRLQQLIQQHEQQGLGVSVVSCWEVAKLVEKGRLKLDQPVETWVNSALQQPHVSLLELTPAIAVAATQLPPPFHADPADQLIVATARVLKIPLLTVDQKILNYAHVDHVT